MPGDRPLSAEDVARRQFATSFRGFEQHEVRAFLAQVAAELASLQERERALRQQVAAAEARPPAVPEMVDDAAMEAALGAETTRVIHAAREAAAEIRQRAEESVARLVREANAEASRLRHEAEAVLAERTEEAEAAAAAIREEAAREVEELRTAAQAQAAAAVEEAQRQGKEMVAEAQAVRQRMLTDLSRRRARAIAQLEQLRAGRERLLQAYEVVRETLEQATSELSVAEAEAREAAEAAAARAPEAEPIELPEPDSARESEPVGGAPASGEGADDGPAPALSIVPAPEPGHGEEPDGRPRPVAVGRADDDGPAEPPPAPDPPAEERRSSALRLLRRKQDAPSADLPPLDDEVEGVRIIRAAPEPAEDQQPAGAPPAGQEAQAPPEPPAEPAAEVQAGEGPEPAPEGDDAAAEPVTEEHPAVDDLFARLRADRAAAVEHAEEVLATAEAAGGEPEAAPVEEAEPEPEPEPAGEGEAALEARDAAVEGAERALVRALKRALADEQNEVLDTLRRLKGRPTVEALLPDDGAQAGRYASAATRHLAAGAEAGSAAAGGTAEVGVDVDVLAAEVAAEVAGDLRARVERAVDQAGGDAETLQDALSAAYREWKSSRAEAVGRHAVAAAFAAGAFAATAGDLVWVVDPAEGGCPDCDDNALAGPTPKGEPFPTGQLHPPAHAGCRCIVLPAPS